MKQVGLLSERGTEDLLGLLRGDAPLWLSDKRLKQVWCCWHSLRASSTEDSSFRVQQNCKEGWSLWNKRMKPQQTAALWSIAASAEQHCTAWCASHLSKEVSVHCSGRAALPYMVFFWTCLLIKSTNYPKWHKCQCLHCVVWTLEGSKMQSLL